MLVKEEEKKRERERGERKEKEKEREREVLQKMDHEYYRHWYGVDGGYDIKEYIEAVTHPLSNTGCKVKFVTRARC